MVGAELPVPDPISSIFQSMKFIENREIYK